MPDAEAVIGMDTSPEMVEMAKFLTRHLSAVASMFKGAVAVSNCKAAMYAKGNAEHTELPSRTFDLVTVFYGFHEAPHYGRQKIVEEARRLLRSGGLLAVVDICPDYQPSPTMLSGEPYVIEYQKNIHKQMNAFKGFSKAKYRTMVPNHVGMWLLQRA
jgi:ubiquinone/menaquinone biosynthesis C-methylase UbiE